MRVLEKKNWEGVKEETCILMQAEKQYLHTGQLYTFPTFREVSVSRPMHSNRCDGLVGKAPARMR